MKKINILIAVIVFSKGDKMEDKDFETREIVTVRLKNSKGELLTKQLLVTDDLFLIFRGVGKKLENDLSLGWKNYLSKTPEAEQRRNETFRRVARQDARLAMREDDGMPQAVKKAIFNSDELDEKSKEKFEEFKADLEADNVDLI